MTDQASHPLNFPGESLEYREARDRLLEAEMELRRSAEMVAAMRRELPSGGPVAEDYLFDGAAESGGKLKVRLSELFGPERDTLIVYSFMYGPTDDRPCPLCTSLLDSLDGAAPHVTQRVSLAVVAKSPLERILAFARQRRWRNLRLLSSAQNTYNRDYFGEVLGFQLPMLNVFVTRGGTIRHFWGAELLYGPAEDGQHPRHADPIWPIWGLHDLTPEGRDRDWQPELSYVDDGSVALGAATGDGARRAS